MEVLGALKYLPYIGTGLTLFFGVVVLTIWFNIKNINKEKKNSIVDEINKSVLVNPGIVDKIVSKISDDEKLVKVLQTIVGAEAKAQGRAIDLLEYKRMAENITRLHSEISGDNLRSKRIQFHISLVILIASAIIAIVSLVLDFYGRAGSVNFVGTLSEVQMFMSRSPGAEGYYLVLGPENREVLNSFYVTIAGEDYASAFRRLCLAHQYCLICKPNIEDIQNTVEVSVVPERTEAVQDADTGRTVYRCKT